jgi:hypothetical protein
MELKGGYNGEQVFGVVKGAVKREMKNGHPVTVVFTGRRTQTLGGLPAKLIVNGEKAGVGVTDWCGEEAARVVTAVLPSVGAVNIDWIKTLQTEGVRDVVIVSHPYNDSQNREDAHWILNRLQLRPALVTAGLHWVEVAPGDSMAVEKYLDTLHSRDGQSNKRVPVLPPVKDRGKMVPSLVSALIGTALLLGLFAIALPMDVRAGMSASEESALRIAVDAKGKVELARIPEGVILPEGADPAKIFGGRHYPMSVRVLIDGMIVLDETYKPSGISGNGRIAGLEFIEVKAGVHRVEILIRDDSDEFRSVFSGEVDFEKGKVKVLEYDEAMDEFVLR